MKQELKTTTLRNGIEVTAKLYCGELYPVTYANRKQAEVALSKMPKNEGWDLYHFSRPFYVGRKN